MIVGFTLILLCQLIGEVFVRGFAIPIPGPVAGMVLLLLLLGIRERFSNRLPAELAGDDLPSAGKGLLAHLSLLFVPAGVGVVQRLDLLGTHGLALAITIAVSTLAAMLATVLTFVVMARWIDSDDADEKEEVAS